MNSTSRLFAWCFVGSIGLFLGAFMLMSAAGRGEDSKGFQFRAFGLMPVLDHGRVKPMDTLARISLMIISGRQEYRDEKDTPQPATRWLLDVMTAQLQQADPENGPVRGPSRKVPAYRIEDPALLKILRLDGKSTNEFSFEQIYRAGEDGMKQVISEALAIRKRNPDVASDQDVLNELSTEERAVFELGMQLLNHIRFAEHETTHRVFRIDNKDVLAVLGLSERSGFRYGFDEILPRLTYLEQAARTAGALKAKDRQLFDQKAIETFRHVELYLGLADGNADTLHLIAPGDKTQDFRTLASARREGAEVDRKDPEAAEQLKMASLFDTILRAYGDNNPQRFNASVEMYNKEYRTHASSQAARTGTEASFNSFAPFYVCMILYGTLFVVVAVFWVWQEPIVHRFAFWATIMVVLVHTWALIMRMYIQGRPPVTNLYSSAVFIGWVCVLVTLIVEWIFRNGLAMAVGIVTGGLTLLIAHHLGGSGDTLEMMEAVLDTNFWLATHVTAVTIGYSATFVAGFFGLLTVLMVVGVTVSQKMGYQAELSYSTLKLLGKCIYGVVCFAMLFSFLGTVLGGIWADVSWGRFWGWDPKENGALLIVIMNAIILHARWGGMIKERGMAILAMVGNMVTMWSWFGTNQLGIGLHSYGFNNTLILLCRYFWVSQFLVIGLALVPFKAWFPPFQATPPRSQEPTRTGPILTAPKMTGRRNSAIQGGAS